MVYKTYQSTWQLLRAGILEQHLKVETAIAVLTCGSFLSQGWTLYCSVSLRRLDGNASVLAHDLRHKFGLHPTSRHGSLGGEVISEV